MYKPFDRERKAPAVETFATKLKEMFPALSPSPTATEPAAPKPPAPTVVVPPAGGQPSGVPQGELLTMPDGDDDVEEGQPEAAPADHLAALREKAVSAFKASRWFGKMDGEGVAWGSLKALFLEQVLPAGMDSQERADMAYQLVPHVMTNVFGAQNREWHAFPHPVKRGSGGRPVIYVKKGPKPANT
jgi:hypothetical protein